MILYTKYTSASGNDKPYRSVIVTCEPVITSVVSEKRTLRKIIVHKTYNRVQGLENFTSLLLKNLTMTSNRITLQNTSRKTLLIQRISHYFI